MRATTGTISTELPPTLAANANRMFLAYQQDDSDDIRWASYDGAVFDKDSKTFDTSNAVWTFQLDAKIDGDSLETDEGLSIQADAYFIYMVYESDDHIGWATYDLENDVWQGGKHINKGKTSDAPALLVGETTALVTYRGKSKENIYWMFT